MIYVEEDFERAKDLDMMWFLEKEAEMFVQWQMWENEQEAEHERLPAEIVIMIPKLKLDEV